MVHAGPHGPHDLQDAHMQPAEDVVSRGDEINSFPISAAGIAERLGLHAQLGLGSIHQASGSIRTLSIHSDRQRFKAACIPRLWAITPTCQTSTAPKQHQISHRLPDAPPSCTNTNTITEGSEETATTITCACIPWHIRRAIMPCLKTINPIRGFNIQSDGFAGP